MATKSKPTDNSLPEMLRDAIVGLVRRDGPDLSIRQLGVLLITDLENGPHTVRGLAERLNVARPAIASALNRLEQLGLVGRAADPADRRGLLVGRTAPGAAYLSHLRKLLEASKPQAPAVIAERNAATARPA